MRAEKVTRNKPLLISLFWLAIILVVFFLMIGNAFAQEPLPTQPVQGTPVTDDQVNAIAKQMFCPVCENIPLDVCPTQACAQWRDLIREKLSLGWSEKQIKDYFVDQYGARVLGAPPAQGINWLVYVVPPLAILAGAFILYKALRVFKPGTAGNRDGSIQASNIDAPLTETGSPAGKNGKAQTDEYVRRLEEELRKRE